MFYESVALANFSEQLRIVCDIKQTMVSSLRFKTFHGAMDGFAQFYKRLTFCSVCVCVLFITCAYVHILYVDRYF